VTGAVKRPHLALLRWGNVVVADRRRASRLLLQGIGMTQAAATGLDGRLA
jgi:hypothetical protein